MELLLIRHGKAEDYHPFGDSARPLTAKGIRQAQKAGAFCTLVNWLPELVLTSPYVRAQETANHFCTAANLANSVIQGWLSCGMSPQLALSELSAFNDFNRIAIVGHEPDFSCLIQTLLGANAGTIEIKKASLTCIEISPPSSYGTLKFLIPSKFTVANL